MIHVYDNLVHMLLSQSRKYGERCALRYKKNGTYHDVSWNHLVSLVHIFSHALSHLGVEKQSTVCLMSENRPEWVVSDMAILSLGAVTVPIYTTTSEEDIAFIVKNSKARFFIASQADFITKAIHIRDRFNLDLTIIHLDGASSVPNKKIYHYDGLIHSPSGEMEHWKEEFENKVKQIKHNDVATLIYTSGTTGTPKGVILTHRNFLTNCEGVRQVIPINDQDVHLSFLPLSHVFERMAGYYFLLSVGAIIAYAESIDLAAQNMQEVHPTISTAVPRVFEKMKVKILDQAKGSKKNILDFALQIGTVVGRNKLDGKHISIFMRLLYSVMNVLVYKKIRQKLGGRLRFFISGGAPLGKELAEFFYSLDILICEGYGLTETSPVISGNTPVFFKFGTVGKPLPNVEVKISEDREIVVRGDSVMQGYFQNEEATREVLKDGWFYTGDIGEFDSEGFLKITDRKKDIIKTSGGKMIAPQRIENLLKESPFISQIVVCGDKRRYITALIVPQYEAIIKEMATRGVVLSNAGEVIKNNEVANLLHAEIERLTESLAPIEKIKYFRLLPNEFTQAAGELTPTLKVKRRVIQEKYKNWIDQMYEEK